MSFPLSLSSTALTASVVLLSEMCRLTRDVNEKQSVWTLFAQLSTTISSVPSLWLTSSDVVSEIVKTLMDGLILELKGGLVDFSAGEQVLLALNSFLETNLLIAPSTINTCWLGFWPVFKRILSQCSSPEPDTLSKEFVGGVQLLLQCCQKFLQLVQNSRDIYLLKELLSEPWSWDNRLTPDRLHLIELTEQFINRHKQLIAIDVHNGQDKDLHDQTVLIGVKTIDELNVIKKQLISLLFKLAQGQNQAIFHRISNQHSTV
jgi:hypothetical protein